MNPTPTPPPGTPIGTHTPLRKLPPAETSPWFLPDLNLPENKAGSTALEGYLTHSGKCGPSTSNKVLC